MWDAAQLLWDGYLNQKARISMLLGVLLISETPGQFAPGELLRTSWRMEIQRLLEDVPSEDDPPIYGPLPLRRRSGIQHPSPLIRTIGEVRMGSFYRGIDVFTAMYFVKLSALDAAVKLRANGLIQRLSRNTKEDEASGGTDA